MAGRCAFGCRPELGGPWVPAFAGKTMREFSARLGPPRFSDSSALSLRFPRESGGPGAAVVPLPREWISAQWIFRRHDAWVLVKSRHLLCCGGHGGSMPFWLPSRARWSLGPGVRWEDDERALRQIGPPRFSDSSALSLRSSPESGGPGAAMVPRPREWISAQWIFRRHDA